MKGDTYVFLGVKGLKGADTILTVLCFHVNKLGKIYKTVQDKFSYYSVRKLVDDNLQVFFQYDFTGMSIAYINN